MFKKFIKYFRFVVNYIILKILYRDRINISSFNLGAHNEIIIKDKSYLEIGKNVSTYKNVTFAAVNCGTLKIGERCFINRNVNIIARKNISIGEDCMLGPNVCIYDHNHKFERNKIYGNVFFSDDIVIGSNCWIGANSIILKGTHLGNHVIVGAGSIISGNVPDNTIVYSNRDLKFEQLHD